MWQGIVGHDLIAEQFCRSLAGGRLASTFLFLGPSGVGKRSFALKLAEALLCQARASNTLEPCGQCESCRLAAAGNHPDLDVIRRPDGKRLLPVELFIGDRQHRNREGLCHQVALRPRLGQRRVAIIDDADFLTRESANSLLKTLEEPPPSAVLILIGTSQSRQLPTILSRTQIVRFSPLPRGDVARLALDLGIAADQSQADLLAEAAEGSVERASELADAEHWELAERLLPALEPARFDAQRLAGTIGTFVGGAGKEAEPRRQRLRAVLRLVAEYFRQVLREASGAPATDVAESPAVLQLAQAGGDSADAALAALEICFAAQEQLYRNANQATLLEHWLDELGKALDPLIREPLIRS